MVAWNCSFQEIPVRLDISKLEVIEVIFPDSKELNEAIQQAESGEIDQAGYHRPLNLPHTRKSIFGTLWLTPNRFLSNATFQIRYRDGSVKVNTSSPIEFTLHSGRKLKFRYHSKWTKNGEGDDVTFHELSAEFRLTSSGHKKRRVDTEFQQELDDFLLITSFASRYCTICIGWSLSQGPYESQYYRRGIKIPSLKEEQRFEDALIGPQDFESFLARTQTAFNSWDEERRELMRQVIRNLMLAGEQSPCAAFISLYSAVETLILHYRHKHDLEFALSSEKFRKLQKELKTFLSNSSVFTDNAKKPNSCSLIKNKLPELNRVSFASAFEAFCQANEHPVEWKDLWPLTGSGSLSAIRNEIVHGQTFNNQRHNALRSAKSHLQWILERMILAVLRWPLEDSGVSSSCLENLTAYQKEHWEADRIVLFKPPNGI